MANPLASFLDPRPSDVTAVPAKYQLGGDWRPWAIPLGAGFLFLLLAAVFGAGNPQRFWFAYLVGWTFCLSISLGALLFVMINHIVRAKWVTVVRRIPELLASNFTLLAILGLPIILSPFFTHDLYHWADPSLYIVGGDHFDGILAGKAAYFFAPLDATSHTPVLWLLRSVLYFGIWIYVSRRVYSLSVGNDTDPRAENTLKLRKTSAWGIPVVGVLTAFAGFDYIMSLDPHFFSTMFGVYFFAGGWLASIAVTIVIAASWRRSGRLEYEISVEHLHDLGKYLFAFTVFWTYIAFSQYFLIWYGDLPEEVVWFQKRLTEGWQYASLALLLGHFIIPFFVLLPRFSKRIVPILSIMAVWIIVMHWFDLWWQAVPSLYEASYSEGHAALAAGSELLATAAPMAAEGPAEGHAPAFHVIEASFSPMDLLAWLGIAGLYASATIWRASRHALTPYNDPYYPQSLRFENV